MQRNQLPYQPAVQASSEPSPVKRIRKYSCYHDIEFVRHKLLQELHLILLPERIHAPETEVVAYFLHPGSLVDGLHRTRDYAFYPETVLCIPDSVPEIAQFAFLYAFRPLGYNRDSHGLGLQPGDLYVRCMEHVAFHVL